MQSESAPTHRPVLLEEVLEAFEPLGDEALIVDATVGLGGHAEALLEGGADRRLIGIDRDPEALRRAGERLARFGERVRLVEGRHEELIEILDRLGEAEVDGVLADLGVSSMQFDQPERGFSFRFDAPLDMRMGREGETAADLVMQSDEQELVRILREYGEEPMARKIARAIVEERQLEPITTTTRLAAIVRQVKKGSRERIDPATLTFQALRIAVNREIVELERFVNDAVAALKTGGRIGIVSFHSLEDRIVKQALRRFEGRCSCPPRMPVCRCGAKKVVEVLTRRPMVASDEEVAGNPRARSARFRVAEKVDEVVVRSR
jgi:16S rRNA (cytosine1402-N4)-methyltransferase